MSAGWVMTQRPTTHKVTRGLAERFAAMEPCPGDRDYKESRAKFIETVVKNGSFRTCEWAECHCKETGKVYRVNGKHTSRVMARLLQDGHDVDQHVVVEHYEAETLEGVARLYATFDSMKASRRTSDINRAFAAGVESLGEVGARIIDSAVTGMAMATWGADSYSHVDPDMRAGLLAQYPEFPLWIHDTLGNYQRQKNGHIFRGAVLAAMFLTFQKSRRAASEFWQLVCDGSGPDHTSGDRLLYKLLVQSVARTHGRKSPFSTNRELMVKCIHAWNAWREGTITDLRYYAESKIPNIK